MADKSESQDLAKTVRRLLKRSAELREGLTEVLQRVEKLDSDLANKKFGRTDADNAKK